MGEQQKRWKLIVTDVEITEWPRTRGAENSSIDIKLAKGLKPSVKARVTKALADINVHKSNTYCSAHDQRYKLTVADVEKSSSSAWRRRSRPLSIIDIEVDHGLNRVARDRVKSTLDRVRDFYVVEDNPDILINNRVVVARPGRPFLDLFMMMAGIIFNLIICGLVMMFVMFVFALITGFLIVGLIF